MKTCVECVFQCKCDTILIRDLPLVVLITTFNWIKRCNLPPCSDARFCRPAACSMMSFNTITSKITNGMVSEFEIYFFLH